MHSQERGRDWMESRHLHCESKHLRQTSNEPMSPLISLYAPCARPIHLDSHSLLFGGKDLLLKSTFGFFKLKSSFLGCFPLLPSIYHHLPPPLRFCWHVSVPQCDCWWGEGCATVPLCPWPYSTSV